MNWYTESELAKKDDFDPHNDVDDNSIFREWMSANDEFIQRRLYREIVRPRLRAIRSKAAPEHLNSGDLPSCSGGDNEHEPRCNVKETFCSSQESPHRQGGDGINGRMVAPCLGWSLFSRVCIVEVIMACVTTKNSTSLVHEEFDEEFDEELDEENDQPPSKKMRTGTSR